MTTIIENIRNLVEDNLKYTSDSCEYLTSKVFTLTESNINYVDATSITAYKNGALFASSNYTFSVTTGKITVTGTLVAGDVIEFVYYCYEKYSDTEIRGYIRSAISYLAVEQYGVFTAKSDNIIFPTPTEKEEHLIAMIAGILIKPPISSYRTPEITINFTEKLTKEEKICRLIKQFKKSYGSMKYIKLDDDNVTDAENL